MEFFIILTLIVCTSILMLGAIVLVWQLFGVIDNMLEARKRKQYRQLPKPVIHHTL